MALLKPIALFVLILYTSLVVQPNNANDITEETCNKTPNYTLCIQYLKSDNSSSDASVLQLAIIMFRVMGDKSVTTLTKINQILPTIPPVNPHAHVALLQCVNLYKSIEVFNARNGINALERDAEPKRAEYFANQAIDKANKCEVHFNGRLDGGTPVTDENNAMNDIGKITAAICQLIPAN